MRIVIIGNCQGDVLGKIISIRNREVQVVYLKFPKAMELFSSGSDLFDEANAIIIQNARAPKFLEFSEKIKAKGNCISFPNIQFRGFCPDYVHVDSASSNIKFTNHHSNIILQAYAAGLSATEAEELFCKKFFEDLGYFKYFRSSLSWLTENINQCGFDGGFLIQKWLAAGDFMYTVNHPKLFVMDDIANLIIKKLNICSNNSAIEDILNDPLKEFSIFPTIMPNKITNNSLFDKNHYYKVGKKIFNLTEFIDHNYKVYDKVYDNISIDPLSRDKFIAALKKFKGSGGESKAINPYSDLPSSSFWRKSVTNLRLQSVEPIVPMEPVVLKDSLVATAGSCFAQHIAKALQENALKYYVVEEPSEDLNKEKAKLLNYGVFSCRYGNIYTSRQLLQLIKMAYGEFKPAEMVWRSKSGKYIDAFRPNIGDEFDYEGDVRISREKHLAFVRSMFENLDVFVFTLGLTESWLSVKDGAVYPVAPGVVSQHNDYSSYQFQNFSHEDVMADMNEFLYWLNCVNPNAKVILTVSPVPLIATYERDHVLNATTYSKSVLRVVANELANAYSHVTYFPSYEIITGSFNRGSYFYEDLRSVKEEGVSHVMRTFINYFTGHKRDSSDIKQDPRQVKNVSIMEEIDRDAEIICDEELIELNL